MDNLINPLMTDALLTLAMVSALLSLSGITLWLLPWTDRSIRSVDKALNPVDLTEESIPLLRLAISRPNLG